MDFFTYTLTALVAFIGLFVGLMFAKTSPDEAHYLKKYIPSLQLLLIILTYLLLFIYFPFYIAGSVFLLSFAFIYLYWRKRDINTIDYVVFATIFVITSLNITAHYYLTAIIFVFGLLAGILFYTLHDKPDLHLVTYGGHKHSGKQLSFDAMSSYLLKKYSFFFFLALIAYVVANLITLIF